MISIVAKANSEDEFDQFIGHLEAQGASVHILDYWDSVHLGMASFTSIELVTSIIKAPEVSQKILLSISSND